VTPNRPTIIVHETDGEEYDVPDDGMDGYYENVLEFLRTSYNFTRYTPRNLTSDYATKMRINV
jgi:hypothetical protein